MYGKGHPITIDFSKKQERDRFRHSASHIMAHAVKSLFPDAKLAIGPPIEDGFYYDFELRQALTLDVLGKIEEASRLKRERGYRYVIEVDGGVKPDNAASVRQAGAQILVAGTAVFGSGDRAEAIRAIRGQAMPNHSP